MTTIVCYKGTLAVDSANTKYILDKEFTFNNVDKLFKLTDVFYNNIKVLYGSAAGNENIIIGFFKRLNSKPANLLEEFKLLSNNLNLSEVSFIFLLETGNCLLVTEKINDNQLYYFSIEEFTLEESVVIGSGYDYVKDLKLSDAQAYCEVACVFDKYSSFPIRSVSCINNILDKNVLPEHYIPVLDGKQDSFIIDLMRGKTKEELYKLIDSF